MINDDIFCLQVSVDYALLVEEVEKNEGFSGEELDVLQLNAHLLLLVLAQSQAIDGLHQEVSMLVILEGRIEFWEA